MDEHKDDTAQSTPAGPDAAAGVVRPAATGAAAKDESQEAFAEMLEASGAEHQAQWRKGDKVAAQVVAISAEWVFVSLGGKQEGTIRVEEFSATKTAGEEEPQPTGTLPAAGDTVEAYVLSADAGEVVLTTQLGRRDASLASLEEAWRNGIPVEGRIVRSIKGGFEVRVANVRGFCPLSQVDLRWPRDPQDYVDQVTTFKVVEFKEKGRNIVLSRRALLEEEREQRREEMQATLEPGDEVSGTVRSLQKFGAFVDLGGIDGLIPISELSWQRVEDPGEVVSEGQAVTVKVLTIDWERNRISLSLKALAGNPWTAAADKYQVGERVAGKVVRLAGFGAFVNLEPGIDGLVHISALGAGRRIAHPKEVVNVGDEVEVEVLSVDAEKRKISLSMQYRHEDSLGDLPRAGETITGSVDKVAEFGVFVTLPSGHTGLVHNAEMATERGSDHKRMFPAGQEMQVRVLGVEEGGRRIRLSRKAALRQEEEAVLQSYAPPQGDGGGGFGTLGDLLKAKLKNRE